MMTPSVTPQNSLFRLDDLNAVLLNPDTRVVNDFLAVVAKYGSPAEINAKP